MAGVMAFLSVSQCVALRAVCKRWAETVNDPGNWEVVDLSSYGPAPSKGVPPVLQWLLKTHGKHIRSFSAKGCFLSEEALLAVVAACPRLERFTADDFVPAEGAGEGVPSTVPSLTFPEPGGVVPGGAALPGTWSVGAGTYAPPAGLDARPASTPVLLVPPSLPGGGVGGGGDGAGRAGDGARGKRSKKEGKKEGDADGGEWPELSWSAPPAGPPGWVAALTAMSAAAGRRGVDSLPEVGRRLLSAGGDALADALQACTSLTVLNLSRGQLTDQGVVALARGLPRLAVARLAGNPALSDVGVVALARQCRSLRSLDVSDCPLLTDTALSALGKWAARLRALAAGGNHRITDAGVSDLTRGCRNLSALLLPRCPRLTDAALEAAAQRCASLQWVDVSDAPGLTDTAVDELVDYCEHLEGIGLARCPGVSGEAIAAILTDCPRMRALHVPSPRLSAVSLDDITTASSLALSTLRLDGAGRINDMALAGLAAACPALDTLSLAGCPVRGLARLALGALFGRLSALTSLNVSDAGLDDQSLCFLRLRCPPLRRVVLDRNPLVTVDGFTSVWTGAGRSLRDVSVRDCEGLDDASLHAATGLLPRLTSLDVSGCPISDDGLSALVEASPELAALAVGSGALEFWAQQDASGETPQSTPGDPLPAPTPTPTPAAEEPAGARKKRRRRKKKKGASDDDDEFALLTGALRGRQRSREPRERPTLVPVGDATCLALAGCSKLHTLVAVGCAALSDSGLGVLAHGGCRRALTAVAVGACPGVTGVGLLALAKECPSLRFLSAPFCPDVSAASIAQVRSAASAARRPLLLELSPSQVPSSSPPLAASAEAALEAAANAAVRALSSSPELLSAGMSEGGGEGGADDSAAAPSSGGGDGPDDDVDAPDRPDDAE